MLFYKTYNLTHQTMNPQDSILAYTRLKYGIKCEDYYEINAASVLSATLRLTVKLIYFINNCPKAH